MAAPIPARWGRTAAVKFDPYPLFVKEITKKIAKAEGPELMRHFVPMPVSSPYFLAEMAVEGAGSRWPLRMAVTVVLDGPEEGRPIALAAVGCES